MAPTGRRTPNSHPRRVHTMASSLMSIVMSLATPAAAHTVSGVHHQDAKTPTETETETTRTLHRSSFNTPPRNPKPNPHRHSLNPNPNPNRHNLNPDPAVEVVHDARTPLAAASERDALVAFYHSTNGPAWTTNTHWLMGDPCTDNWYGIVCSEGHVLHLNLAQNNLNGTLPDNFGNLKWVTWVALDIFNMLRGPIPKSIGNMTKMQLFTVAGSLGPGSEGDKLSGVIPDEICNLTSMLIFHGGGNRFTGAPACMCDFPWQSGGGCDLSHNPLECDKTASCLKHVCNAACT
eukprot:m.125753 g.125753  ORF g.125753 m.125753 type:complete len:291 (+) comp11176_c4_seq1:76-948(+)